MVVLSCRLFILFWLPGLLHFLGPSQKIHDMLIERATVVLPQNNTEFNEHFDRVFPGRPSGGNPKYGVGWYNVWRDVWDEQHAVSNVFSKSMWRLFFLDSKFIL